MYLLVLQNCLQEFIPFIRYADELIAISAVAVGVYRFINNIKRGIKIQFLNYGILITVVVGIISSAVYKYQDWNIVFSDLLLVVKFFLTIYLGEQCFSWILGDGGICSTINKHVRFIIYMLALLSILDYAIDIFPGTERYGIKSLQLFYGHPTSLTAVMAFLMAVYTATSNKKMRLFDILLCCVIASFTLRSKAFALAASAVMLYFILIKGKKKINVFYIVLGAIILYGLAYNQISYYYGVETDGFARQELNEASIEIAKDYFPIGTGFGTYASYFSGVEYSPVYYKYGLNTVWGLTKDNPAFVADTFWPMIIGQFGLIGTIGYIASLIVLFVKIQKLYNINITSYYSGLLAFVYLFISSTAETAFVHPMAIPLALIMGMVCGQRKNNDLCGSLKMSEI